MSTAAPHKGTLGMIAALLRYRTPLMLLTSFLWLLNHATPIFFGTLNKSLFDALAEGPGAGTSPWTYLLLLGGLDVLRIGLLAGGILTFSTYFTELLLLLRRNVIAWLFTAPRARRLTESPSEAVTRFRDDVEDIARFVDSIIDSSGFLTFAVVSLAIMLRIDPTMTVAVLAPMLVAVLFARAMQGPIRSVRRRLREATGRVTDFIGEMMGSVQAIKIAGREDSAMERFRQLNEVRRKAALRDSLLTESFRSVSDNMVSVATGIMLLLAASRMQGGVFTVGDFALFMAYLPYLTGIMTFIGNMLVEYRRAGVAFERLGKLLVDAPRHQLVQATDLQLTGPVPAFKVQGPERKPLRTLEVRNLTYRYPGSSSGVIDVSFTLERGAMTVITGRVGAGKSTLLRALLGLLPADSGQVLWNGEVVQDPASFLVPPHAAYTSQVPRLFSDSLHNNLVLGRRLMGHELPGALSLAVLEHDVRNLDLGLDTQVGSRGVRLSGGQVQRSAAARMFLRDAELLVFDDLSSALDVETESQLWRGIDEAGGATCLVVSHRRPALERADQILVMEGGRISARGTMIELQKSSSAFRELWQAEPVSPVPAD